MPAYKTLNISDILQATDSHQDIGIEKYSYVITRISI
jgi:hypothetical protein